MAVFCGVAPCILAEIDNVSEVLTASIIAQITRRNIAEDSLFHTHRCENLKSHQEYNT
jgi:hypothetical protein